MIAPMLPGLEPQYVTRLRPYTDENTAYWRFVCADSWMPVRNINGVLVQIAGKAAGYCGECGQAIDGDKVFCCRANKWIPLNSEMCDELRDEAWVCGCLEDTFNADNGRQISSKYIKLTDRHPSWDEAFAAAEIALREMEGR